MTKTHRRICSATLFFLFAGFLSGCRALPTGYSDFDAETDFDGFKTFAFEPENTLVVASPNPVNPEIEPTLKDETRKALTSKGYQFTTDPEQADFLVGFTLGGTPTANTTVFTGNQRQVYVVGQSQRAQVVTQEGTQAGIVIDLYERETGQKKWMGWTVDEVTMGDIKRLKVTISELVGVILEHFPPET